MKLHKWSLWLSMVVCIAALALTGCGQDKPKSIKIAHLAPRPAGPRRTGCTWSTRRRWRSRRSTPRAGVKLPDGSQLKIEYTEVDETSNSAGAIEGTKKAISLEPLVIVGPNRSGGVLAAEKLWKEAKIPAITDATSAETTKQGNPYTFRMQISSQYWIPLLVKTAVEKYNIKRTGGHLWPQRLLESQLGGHRAGHDQVQPEAGDRADLQRQRPGLLRPAAGDQEVKARMPSSSTPTPPRTARSPASARSWA